MKPNKHQLNNFNMAVRQTWRKCLSIILYILWSEADWDADGLEEMAVSYWEYLEDHMHNEKELDELIKQFEQATGLHIDEAKLEGTAVQKAVRTTEAVSIRIGALILWYVGEWKPGAIRSFVYRCWDYIKLYPQFVPKIRDMQKQTGIKIR